MTNTLYSIILDGNVLDGFNADETQDKLAKLFKIQPNVAKRMLSGNSLTVKKGVDLETAEKYKKALESAGAQCHIEEFSVELQVDQEASTAEEDVRVDRQERPPESSDDQHQKLSPGSRELMVNGVLVAIVVLAIAVTFRLFGNDNSAPSVPSAPADPYVRAGGWVCGSYYAAAGNARLLSANAMVGFKGCRQIGENITVNVFDRTVFNGYEVVQVGNSTGVVWVWSEHLN